MRADETERAIDGWNRRAPAVPQEVREAMRQMSAFVASHYPADANLPGVNVVRAWLAAQEG